MQHIKCRCKHCQKTYYFCTYGNGPEWGTEPGCSMEYCGECQTAITKALSDIPVRFKARFKEIMPSLGLDKMLAGIKEAKTKKEEARESHWPTVFISGSGEGYDNIETYTHVGKTFRIEWDDDKPEDKHYFIEMEWDIEKLGYTGNHWEAKTYEDTYSFHQSLKPLTRALENTVAKAMDKPNGDLYFHSVPEWDIQIAHAEPKPKEHILRTWTGTYTGEGIKVLLDHGRAFEKVVLGDGLSCDDLVDILDYKTEHQRYDDEDIETITKIEVK